MKLTLFLPFLLLISCAKPGNSILDEPSNLIPREKFISILEEFMVMEQVIQNDGHNYSQMHEAFVKPSQDFFKAHQITEKQFEDSFDFYASDFEDMSKIYEKIQENMAFKLNKLQNN